MAHFKKSPQIACITTIFPDHLDHYKNFSDYIKAKKFIFKWQTKDDFLILNTDDKIVKKFAKEAKAKIIYFSKKNLKNSPFSVENTAAAMTIARILKISPLIIKRALKTFKGIPNHLEFVRKKDGIKYYNDSASTVPQSTIMALNMFTPLKTKNKKQEIKNIVLISGGADKKLDFSEMAKKIKEKCKAVILLPGTATKKIKNKILKIKNHPPIFEVKNMEKAVLIAQKIAERGNIVLLSPGCASFGIFENAYERARQFRRAVYNL